MKRLMLALAAFLWLTPAQAQVCPTVSPYNTSDNRCASTQFVQNAIAGTPANLVVGTTTITGGTAGRVLFQNGAVLGEYTITGTAGSVVLSTAPIIASPTFTGTVAGSNTIPLTVMQQSAANTMLGNWTGSTANVLANTIPSCSDTGGNHLNYVSGTGITCGTGMGNAITALTGDVTATGPGSVAATLATAQPGAHTWALGQTFSSAITYGGVTLANVVTGTGNMVLATAPTVSALTVTGSFTATGLVTNVDLVSPSVAVNGTTCTLGSSCTIFSSLVIGSTTILSGTNTRVLFDNSGALGEYVISGTGSVCMTTNCAMTTPSLGAATATSINGNTFTTGTYTLTGTAAKTLTFSNSVTLAGTDGTTWTGAATNMTLTGLNITGQTITGGAIVTSLAQSTGNITVVCGDRPIQTITNNGAYTITAPASDSFCLLKVTNGASAGATTFTGFSVGSNVGDALTTTNGNKFIISLIRAGGDSTYSIKALQ